MKKHYSHITRDKDIWQQVVSMVTLYWGLRQ